jgi:endo-1,4-beta-xylanase
MPRRPHALRWALLAVPLALLLAACTDSGPDCGDPDDCTLGELGETVDLRIGAAVRTDGLEDDATYRTLASEEFASLTPDAELKWQQIEPEPYQYSFERADQIVELAEANDQEIRGHNLFWGQRKRTPDHINAIRDPDSLRAAMRLHAETVLSRYQGRIPRYDVVNEPFVYDTVERADSIYQEVLGDEWIALAFELAHEVDPDAELWINMTGATRVNGKHEAQLALVRELLDAGIPLHGVGLETHIGVDGWSATQYAGFVADYEALGVEVALTEVDYPAFGDTVSDEETARIYGEMVALCAENEACVEVTFWSWHDAYLNTDRLDPEATPGLFDSDGERKPQVAQFFLESEQ